MTETSKSSKSSKPSKLTDWSFLRYPGTWDIHNDPDPSKASEAPSKIVCWSCREEWDRKDIGVYHYNPNQDSSSRGIRREARRRAKVCSNCIHEHVENGESIAAELSTRWVDKTITSLLPEDTASGSGSRNVS